MRNPERIEGFCNRLAIAWRKFPDLRFGQLIWNCFNEMANEGTDPFFPEDEEMISYIERLINEWSGNGN